MVVTKPWCTLDAAEEENSTHESSKESRPTDRPTEIQATFGRCRHDPQKNVCIIVHEKTFFGVGPTRPRDVKARHDRIQETAHIPPHRQHNTIPLFSTHRFDAPSLHPSKAQFLENSFEPAEVGKSTLNGTDD